MNERNDEELDPRLQERLVRRYGEDRPAPELEERVADELHRHGLLSRTSATTGTRWRYPAGAAAAATLLVVAFLAGVWTGRATLSPRSGSTAAAGIEADAAVEASPERPDGVTDAASGPAATYLLLLLEPADQPVADGDVTTEARLVREYSAWARDLAADGRLVRGEKLGQQVRVLSQEGVVAAQPENASPRHDGDLVVTGFFLVRAPSLERATDLARSCPHLRHGGTIEVRPIEPT